jgi:hypothetical protein
LEKEVLEMERLERDILEREGVKIVSKEPVPLVSLCSTCQREKV